MASSDKVNIAEFLRNSFIKRFPDLANRVDEVAIQEWLDKALIAVTEYNGTLPGETRKQRDQRMKCAHVYDGEYKELSHCLRNTYPNERTTSVPDLILKAYSGISNVYDVLGKEVSEVNPTTEEPKAEVEQTNAHNSNSVEEPTATKEPEVTKTDDEENEAIEASNLGTASNTETAEGNTTQPTNKLFNNRTEEIKMADAKEILNNPVATMTEGTEGLDLGNATEVKEEKKTRRSNLSKEEQKEKTLAVKDMIDQDSLVRRAENRTNLRISAIVCTQEPAAKRAIGNQGTFKTAKDSTYEKTVQANFARFVNTIHPSTKKNAEGQIVPWDYDDVKDMPLEEMLAEVQAFDQTLPDKNAKRAERKNPLPPIEPSYPVAKAIVDMFRKEVSKKEEERTKFVCHIPEDPSYAQKGVQIDGELITDTELVAKMLDDTMGFIAAEGETVGDANAIRWELSSAEDKSKKQTTDITSLNRVSRKLIYKCKNKKEWLKKNLASRVVFAYKDTVAEKTDSSNFRIMIDVPGKGLTDATVRCLISTGTTTNSQGENVPEVQTKTVSISASVPVKAVDKSHFNPDFEKGAHIESANDAALRWGYGKLKEKAENFWESDVTNLAGSLAIVAASGISANNKLGKGSALFQKLAAAKDASQKAADVNGLGGLDV